MFGYKARFLRGILLATVSVPSLFSGAALGASVTVDGSNSPYTARDTISGTDSVVVQTGGTIQYSATGNAIQWNGAATGVSVTNNGTITSSATLPTIGSLSGSASGTFTLTNDGTIASSHAAAVSLSGLGSGSVVTIVNNGTISGANVGISATISLYSYTSTLPVTGSAIGVNGATAGTITENFTNTGTINGSVSLSNGTNVVNLTTGSAIIGALSAPVAAAGTTTINLSGSGEGVARGSSETYAGAPSLLSFFGWNNIGTLNVNSGTWDLIGAGAYNNVTIAPGAVFNVCGSASCASTYASSNISGGGVIVPCSGTSPACFPTSDFAIGTPKKSGIGALGTSPLTIVDNGSLVLSPDGSPNIAVGITGSGSLTVNQPVTLSGATYTFTGGTTVNATGALFVAYNVSAANAAAFTNGAIVDNGQVELHMVDNYTMTGTITGTGYFGYVPDGDPTIILTGSQTNTGAIEFAPNTKAGVLQIGNGGTSGAISGASEIDNGGTLAFDRSDTYTLASPIKDDFSTPGYVNQIGSGTTILSGNNSYTGGTTVAAGTLIVTGSNVAPVSVASGATFQIGNGGATGSLGGSLADNGTAVFDLSGNYTYAGALTGSGTLVQAGTGTTILTGTSTYTGPTTVNGGTLDVKGSIANSSGVTVASGGTLASSVSVPNVTVQSGGTISPGDAQGVIGTLNVKGNLALNAGATTFIEVNGNTADSISATGTASINGTLGVAFASGSYAPATYTIVSAAGGVTGSYASVLALGTPSGFAANVSYDANDVILNLVTGFNPNASFNQAGGSINVNGSQTTSGLSGTSGTINTSGGTLTDNQSGNTTYAGNLSGNGNFAKSGTGTLILDGNSSSFTGTTTVNNGLLEVGDLNNPNATLGGTVNVGSGGTLGGHGTINGSVTNAGGTAPGGSIGTLHVTGNYTFASGSTLQQEVAANGNADLLRADGTVTIAGNSTVQVQPTDSVSSYARVTNYTIVTGGGGVNGTFAGATSSVAGFTPILSYSGSAVNLALVRNDISLTTLATSGNQTRVAGAINAGSGALYAAVAPSSDAVVRSAFDQLSGEAHATTVSAILEDDDFLASAIEERPDSADGISVWGAPSGRWAHFASGSDTAAASAKLMGFAGGADAPIALGGGATARLGAALGYSSSTVDVNARSSEGRVSTTYIGGYASVADAGAAATIGLTYAWHNIGLQRVVNAASLSEIDTADYNGTSLTLFGEARYRFDFTGAWIEPLASVVWSQLDTDAFHEAGGIAALNGASKNQSVGFFTLGARAGGSYALGSTIITPQAMLGWQRAAGAVKPDANLAFASSGQSFAVLGAPLSQDAAIAKAGAGIALGGNTGLDIFYTGRFGGRVEENAVTASLGVHF